MLKPFLFISLCLSLLFAQNDPLPSWQNGPLKSRIVAYLDTVTDVKHKDYVPAEERIAVFDNDGTLWSEKPMYFQLAYVIDQVKALAIQHPEWKTEQPFKAVLENDMKSLKSSGEHGLLKLVMATHSGMDTQAFTAQVKTWLASAKHPEFKRPYTDLVYQPMLELLQLLKQYDFKVFIVSGGGVDFMRAWVPEVYGIPTEHIIGSRLQSRYENGKIIKEAKIAHINDKEGKPIGIDTHIGKRPLIAVGNSDGDFAMMRYSEGASSLQLLLHHTDDKREFAYDKTSSVGRLDKALTYAKSHNWDVIDMKKDWKVIYPFEKAKH